MLKQKAEQMDLLSRALSSVHLLMLAIFYLSNRKWWKKFGQNFTE
jgi:hypothetical protein